MEGKIKEGIEDINRLDLKGKIEEFGKSTLFLSEPPQVVYISVPTPAPAPVPEPLPVPQPVPAPV